MSDVARSLLREWLFRRLADDARTWLSDQVAALNADPSDEALYIAFGLVPRRLGKGSLDLSAADQEAARRALDGWSPAGWSLSMPAAFSCWQACRRRRLRSPPGFVRSVGRRTSTNRYRFIGDFRCIQSQPPSNHRSAKA
jgi:hypothetical protein